MFNKVYLLFFLNAVFAFLCRRFRTPQGMVSNYALVLATTNQFTLCTKAKLIKKQKFQLVVAKNAEYFLCLRNGMMNILLELTKFARMERKEREANKSKSGKEFRSRL